MAIPGGIIFLWHGAIVSIPVGYALCDGNNGTPDLRDRFIVGAGSTFNPGDTGGANTHTHTFTSDGHFHTLPAAPIITSGPDLNNQSDTKQDTGTTDAGSSLPPYYALAYIMKL